MASATTVCLSKHDASVLGALFDPEASLQNPAVVQADDDESQSSSDIRELERQALLSINEEAPSHANIEKAINKLSSIIATYPSYASAWNNRAQATRMLFDIADSPHHASKLQSVYGDLSKAIDLSSPKGASMTVSTSAATVLASAHTHRGYILWRGSRPEASEGVLCSLEELKGLSKERLEELASREFSLGGRFGNQTAQQLAVKINPYAKLCGSIVREAMQKEMAEYRQQIALAT